jgi:hypothetical protein
MIKVNNYHVILVFICGILLLFLPILLVVFLYLIGFFIIQKRIKFKWFLYLLITIFLGFSLILFGYYWYTAPTQENINQMKKHQDSLEKLEKLRPDSFSKF